MEGKREFPPSKNLEVNALRKIREVIIQHGKGLSDAYKSGSSDKFYDIARGAGFRPKEVPIGTMFIDTIGRKEMVTRYNPARMGQGNILYVAVEKGGLVSFEGLAHDVSAILLGEMRPHPDWSSTISIPTFNRIAGRSASKIYTIRELNEMKLLTLNKEKGLVIAATHLLDAIVFERKIPYGVIKYA